MGTYASASQVQSRNPYRTISASSSPTTTQVNEYIAEAEGLVGAALAGMQLTNPNVNANGIIVIRKYVIDYAEGRVRQAYASAGGDDDNDDGKDLIQGFNDWIKDMITNPSTWGAMLEGGSAPSGSIRLRSITTNNSDDWTVTDGDFDPEFEKGDVL